MALSSWVAGADGSGRPVEHLPYGCVSATPDGVRRLGVAIGDSALLLGAAAEAGLLDVVPQAVLRSPTLNPLLALGPAAWAAVRARLTELLTDSAARDRLAPALVPLAECVEALACDVADYVDFYSSEHHAENVGQIFRPDSPALPPNWRHLPIGYHGRAGTVVVCGTPVVRPRGQRKPPAADGPDFGPTRRLDIEVEVGFVVGVPTDLGDPVGPGDFAEHVFGVVLVNDWSARDIQAWEYVPLGPFLGKSFATSVSAWVTPLAALAEARVAPPAQEPAVLPYLVDADPWSLDLELELSVGGEVVSRPPYASMYWTPGQQLAHLTVNGASLRTGDLYASGTVSGPEADQRGSLLELSWGGREPVALPSGRSLAFLEDGDEVVHPRAGPRARRRPARPRPGRRPDPARPRHLTARRTGYAAEED